MTGSSQAFLGFLRIHSTEPLLGTATTTVRTGGAFGPLLTRSAIPLQAQLGTSLVSEHFNRGNPSGRPDSFQWSTLLLANPSDQAATVSVRLFDNEGGNETLNTSVTLPPRSRWHNRSSTCWQDLEDTDSDCDDLVPFAGWAEVDASCTSCGLVLSIRNHFRDIDPTTCTGSAQECTQEDDALAFLDEATGRPSSLGLAEHILPRWGERNLDTGLVEDTIFVISNSNAGPVEVEVEEFYETATHGFGVTNWTRFSIPSGGSWKSWERAPSPTGHQDWHWLRIRTVDGEPVRVASRVRVRESGDLIQARDQLPIDPSADLGRRLEGDSFVLNWHPGNTSVRQDSSLRVLNPHGTTAKVKATFRRFDPDQGRGMQWSVFKTLESGKFVDFLPDSESMRGMTGTLSVVDTAGETHVGANTWVRVEANIPVAAHLRHANRSPDGDFIESLEQRLVPSATPPAVPTGKSVILFYVDDLDVRSLQWLLEDDQMPLPYPLTTLDELLHDPPVGSRTTRFEESFVVESLCCPSRATLLSGQYGHRNGVVHNHNESPDGGGHLAVRQLEHDSLGPWLLDAGYRTGWIGKYVNGYPYLPASVDQFDHPDQGPPGWQTFKRSWGDENSSVLGQRTDVGQFLTEAWSTGEPFFLVVSTNEPHLATHAFGRDQDGDDRDWDYLSPWTLDYQFDLLHTPLPSPLTDAEALAFLVAQPNFDAATLPDRPPFLDPGFNALGGRPRLPSSWLALPPTPADPAGFAIEHIQSRFGAIRTLDETLGGVVDQIRGRDDVVLIFVSDNGHMQGQHRLWGKHAPYEDSIRVPFIVWEPVASSGGGGDGVATKFLTASRGSGTVTTNHALVLNTDLAPTILDFAEAEPYEEDQFDGRSLVPLVEGELPGDPTGGWRHMFGVSYHSYFAPLPDSTASDYVTKRRRMIWEIPSFRAVRSLEGAADELYVDWHHSTGSNGLCGSPEFREYFDMGLDLNQIDNRYDTLGSTARLLRSRAALCLSVCGTEGHESCAYYEELPLALFAGELCSAPACP